MNRVKRREERSEENGDDNEMGGRLERKNNSAKSSNSKFMRILFKRFSEGSEPGLEPKTSN